MSVFSKLEEYNDRVALIDESGREMCYGELLYDADAIAGQTGGRCLVFLTCRNTVEAIAAYVGFLRARVVPVLLNGGIDPVLLRALTESYCPDYFFLPREMAADIEGRITFEYGGYVLIKTTYNSESELFEELALLLTTSGSTGSPKLVRQSYRNIDSNTQAISEYLGILPEDKAITTLPMSYTYGLSIITSHLYAGAGVLLTDASLVDKRFWSLLREQKATNFGGVPYIYEMLKKLRFVRMELPNVRYLTQAGGKLSRELTAEFYDLCEKKGMKFIVMYGQTEATARMGYLPWEYAGEKAGSIGVAIPGGEFWLIDADGREITETEVPGELVYRGENVTLGYAENRHDLILGDENQGVLYTGDMAQRDMDGFYYIVGRKKRFLKLFGSRVNLDEIEGLLSKEGYECACTGTDDNLKIYLIDPRCKDGVWAYLTHNLKLNQAGFEIKLISKIPRNEAGKLQYFALG